MSTHTSPNLNSFWHASAAEIDPSIGALQVGYREISAAMVNVDQPIHIHAWAIGFDGRSGASVRYQDIQTFLGTVGGDGLVAISIAGIVGNQFGSMSERIDLIGEQSNTWITTVVGMADHRGAVLAAQNEALLQILTVPPYSQQAAMRSTYLLEAIAASMEGRSPDRFTSLEIDRAAVMERLPALDDLPRSLRNGEVVAESFRHS